MQLILTTPRLRLVSATPELYALAPEDRAGFARLLDAHVPLSWPPEHYDADPLAIWSESARRDPSTLPWMCRYLVERESNTVVGNAGGMEPEGDVWTIGYSILPEYRRRGYASEAVRALVAAAWEHEEVRVIRAETYPSLVASIGVLEKCGFAFVGEGSGEGIIRYELRR